MIESTDNMDIGVERPLTVPEYGAKTAQAVLDIIRLYPDKHDQTEWIGHSSWCGTTMCVAGWAQWLHEGTVRAVVHAFSTHRDAEEASRDYLDLDEYDARKLFYDVTNDEAVAALEYLARGEEIDWDEIL